MNTVNVTRSSMPDFEEYCAEIRDIWDSHWLTNMGVKHRQLESDLKAYLHTPNLKLYVNGHLALENALEALALPAGGEVITTPFTFASTTHAIVRCGLKPVFCDIRPDDYTMDAEQIEALITPETVAMMPVHVYGNMCDVERIGDIAARHGLKVIYDAAHAFGVTYKGVSSANFGDFSMYSFHATKVFNTIEGGALCYPDEGMSTVLDARKNFGETGPEDVPYVGGNAKMNEFAAAMGICNLRHLDGEIEKRRRVVERYRARLSGVAGIQLNALQKDVKSNYAYFPVIFDGYRWSRDQLFDRLRAEGVVARKYFYPLTNSFACYAGKTGYEPNATPVSQHMAERVLTLPLYADLPLEQVDRICDIILH